ncbi:LacI family DNA-binding transcriptional regulator [Latilactobacillus fuchuensis]|uniref:Bacterial regulatory s, lacI family protein n=1 Tax=Latilactobacillus fuchuensis DSM 14340 = JCM 11249 TaxID=1423747 RepID=A0A0R1RRX0_9LACO|nr:LacI family DNA-binding transcriptional regulator [Latilactobacillus fuchuensis]KRL59134.1 bacterial regulatory s, lacI family protein [Latilactobacillus fuchuensis DSM 14340 = JCM 11249]
MATLMDVAKLANVSKMTVSRVINHPEQVTDELKQLVYQAMNELDYRPNIIAKALVSNSTRIIKLCILEDIDVVEPYYMNLMVGIAKALDAHQYSLQLVTRRNIDIGNCDGYIITGLRQPDVEWIQKLTKPFVVFGENRYGFDYVDTNNKKGIQLIAQLALAKGYQHLVYIGMNSQESFEKSREAGYLQQMQDSKLIPEMYHFKNHSRLTEVFVDEHWAQFNRNTVFVCATDRLAIGVERAIAKRGGNIPQEYGITGFDGVFLNQVASPKITTIKQAVIEMGSACGEKVLDKISQKDSQGSLIFEPQIEIGGTLRV